tara:strand:+ start:1218 stop:1982 length:765 start_codon:yes stop_codon:yes gene_type:complete
MIKISVICRIIINILYKFFARKHRFPRYESEEFCWINYSHCSPESKFPLEKQYAIDVAIKQISSGLPILEIGVCGGRSTSFIGSLLAKYGKENALVTVDPWWNCPDGAVLQGPKEKSAESYRQYIKDQYINNAHFWFEGNLPTSFEMDSDTFFKSWRQGQPKVDLFGAERTMGGCISFCYLDGDHGYVQVKKDFDNVDKILEVGGYIYFDDSDRLHRDGGEVVNGCYLAVKEALKSKRYEQVLRNPNYLLRKTK